MITSQTEWLATYTGKYAFNLGFSASSTALVINASNSSSDIPAFCVNG